MSVDDIAQDYYNCLFEEQEEDKEAEAEYWDDKYAADNGN